MKALVSILALALAACSFDESGSAWDGDDETGPDGATTPIDARPIDALPSDPPAIDAAPPIDSWIACDFDGQCENGEDLQICLDCWGGGFICDFDGQCENGEDDNCLDCLGAP